MFLVKLKQSITSLGLQPADGPLLLAISGGPDSVALGEGLWRLGFSLHLAHINYQLRGEDSEEEERLVRVYAQKWSADCWIQQASPKAYATKHGLSLQVACRELRYQFFEELLGNQKPSHCLTAHHADDQVESLLMSLLFGNHPAVMRGIPLRRGPYLRPMLGITKEEIMTFLKEEGLKYGWDVSNDSNDYLRNRIRNQVLPLLEEMQPSVRSQLLQQHGLIQQEQALVQQVLAEFLPKGEALQLDWQAFKDRVGEEHLPLLVRAFLHQSGVHGHVREAAGKLISAQVGKWVETPQGRVIRTRSGLEILDLAEPQAAIQIDQPLNPPVVEWNQERWEFLLPFEEETDWRATDTHYLDADRIHFPLTLRSWQPSDRMQPLGMKANKKLSDIFVDEKYSPSEKQQAWVLEDQRQIVCLQGFRVAESVKITPQTQRILCIRKS